jgi:hypothetical protein
MHPKPIGPPSNIQTNQAYPLPHIIGLTMICKTCQRSTKDNEHGERGKTPLEVRGQVLPLVGHASQTNWAPIQHPNQPSLPSPHIIGLTMICKPCHRSIKDNEHGERGKTPLEMRGQVLPLVGHASQTNWAPIQHPNQPSLPSTTHHWTYYDI